MCFVFVFVILFSLFLAALWSPAWNGLTSWLSLCDVSCVFFTIPYGVLFQVWYSIVSIPGLCLLPYLTVISEDDQETDLDNCNTGAKTTTSATKQEQTAVTMTAISVRLIHVMKYCFDEHYIVNINQIIMDVSGN